MLFDTISTSKIVGFADGNVLSLCPTMELLVLSMNRMSLWVFRLNGERIYSINNKSIIKGHCWSPDGSRFALTGQDKTCKIYDTNEGDLMEQFSFNEELLSVNWNKDTISTDTPSELFKVDVIDNLPFIEEFNNTKDLDYMVVTLAGKWSLIVNNLLLMSMPFPKSAPFESYLPIKSFSFDLFHHVFVMKDTSTTPSSFLLVHAKVNKEKGLRQVLGILCKLQLIFKNVTKVINGMEGQISTFLTLFDRYLTNYCDNIKEVEAVEDTLESKVEHITRSFHKILLTNLIPKHLVDYWLNQFGERGRKRLHKAGNDVYDNIRDVVFKMVINYLEKITILLSELKAVVTFNQIDDDNSLGLSVEVISKLSDDVKSFFARMYQLVWDCNDEQKLFNEYLEWCKYLIEVLTREKNDDDMNVPVTYDYIKLMDYFRHGIFSSKTSKYFDVNLSGTDIIGSKTPEFNSVAEFGVIRSHFDQAVEGFQQYFHSVFDFHEGSNLDVVADNLCTTSYGNKGLAHTLEVNTLKMIEFGPNVQDVNVYKLPMDGTVVTYEVIGPEVMVLSFQEGQFYLSKHSLQHLIGGDITPLHKTKATNENPKYLLANERRNYGCLLDENKKNYCIFET